MPGMTRRVREPLRRIQRPAVAGVFVGQGELRPEPGGVADGADFAGVFHSMAVAASSRSRCRGEMTIGSDAPKSVGWLVGGSVRCHGRSSLIGAVRPPGASDSAGASVGLPARWHAGRRSVVGHAGDGDSGCAARVVHAYLVAGPRICGRGLPVALPRAAAMLFLRISGRAAGRLARSVIREATCPRCIPGVPRLFMRVDAPPVGVGLWMAWICARMAGRAGVSGCLGARIGGRVRCGIPVGRISGRAACGVVAGGAGLPGRFGLLRSGVVPGRVAHAWSRCAAHGWSRRGRCLRWSARLRAGRPVVAFPLEDFLYRG